VAAKKLNYPNFKIYILNDGFVAGKKDWEEVVHLAKKLGVYCITRTQKGGAKAGNLNNGLRQSNGEIVVILDADMVVFPHFLEQVIPYFYDAKVGFVQTPQYYENFEKNEVTRGAWEQQEFFFGPIMKGKEKDNASFICGTNVAIRRSALLEVGGMNETNIAEDFLTSLSIHQKGWKSYYISDVLAVGLAPEDLLSYFKQQLRWARGSLEVLFSQNPLLKGNLSFGQKMQYLSSALYYFNGVIVVIDAIMPIIFLFTGIQPVASTTTSFALYFVPFMFLNLLTLHFASKGSMTFRAISFTQSSFVLQLLAIKSVLLREKSSFAVTPKQAQQGNFLFLAYPHIVYIVLLIVASYVAIYREGYNSSIVTNIAWGLFNVILFIPFIQAAYPWTTLTPEETTDTQYSLPKV
jgi:cellulose synthase (UDP-forming)